MGASRRLKNGIAHRQGREWLRATRVRRHIEKMASKELAASFTPDEPAERVRRAPKAPYGTRNGERISA